MNRNLNISLTSRMVSKILIITMTFQSLGLSFTSITSFTSGTSGASGTSGFVRSGNLAYASEPGVSPGLNGEEKKAIAGAALVLLKKGFSFIDENNQTLNLFQIIDRKDKKVFVVPPRSTVELREGSERKHAYLVEFHRSPSDRAMTVDILAYERTNLHSPISFRSLEMVFPENQREAAEQTLALHQALLSLEIELCGCETDSAEAAERAQALNALKGKVNLIASAVMLTGAVGFLSGSLVAGMAKTSTQSWVGRLLVIGGLAALVGGAVQIYVNEELR